MNSKSTAAVDIKEAIKKIALEQGVEAAQADSIAQKCYDDVYWRPYGGATSFGEIDAQEAVREYTYKVDEETYALKAIIENITSDSEKSVDEKTSAIKTAADEYRSRIAKLPVPDSDKAMSEDKGLWDKIKSWLAPPKEFTAPEPKALPVVSTSGFKVFKEADGITRWISTSSNAFEDLEKELFTTKALEEAVEYADKTDERGPLMFYHIPNTEIGACDFQGIAGRFLIETGTFDDTPLGRKAAEFFSNSEEDWQVSIGFVHEAGDELDGTYDWLRFRERSICPFGTAANPYTDFKVLGDKEMDAFKVEQLKKVFGEEYANGIIAKAESATKEIEESGVRFKEVKVEETKTDVTDTTTVTIAAPSEANPEPVASAPVFTAEQFAALGELLTNLGNEISGMKAALATVDTEIKALKASDDDKIAAALAPKYDPSKGVPASERSDNIVNNPDLIKSLPQEKGELPTNGATPYVQDLLKTLGVAVN